MPTITKLSPTKVTNLEYKTDTADESTNCFWTEKAFIPKMHTGWKSKGIRGGGHAMFF